MLLIPQSTTLVPTNGTSEIQLLTIGGTPTAGNIQFTWANGGRTSVAATWSATNATLVANIQTALDGIFGASNTLAAELSLSSGIGTINITFQGSYAKQPIAFLMTVINNLTGTVPTAAVTRATTGVLASYRQAGGGAQLIYSGQNLVNEVQTLTIGGSGLGGTFTITGQTPQGTAVTTGAITWSGTNATLLSNIQTALDAVFGSGNTTAYALSLTSGIGTINIQFIGTASGAAMLLCTATSSLTGTAPTAVITRATTGGVASTRTGPPIPYTNNSATSFSPTWNPTGDSIQISLGSPALGSGIAVHAGVADNGSSQTISTAITNPDVPRCLVFTPSGTTANVTAVSIVATGTDLNGNVLIETLPAFSAGAATAVTSVNAFKTLTSYVQPACGASVTITPTCSPKLGLGIPMSRDTVNAGYLAGVREATRPTGVAGSGVISKNLVSLSSALNGTAVVIDVTPS